MKPFTIQDFWHNAPLPSFVLLFFLLFTLKASAQFSQLEEGSELFVDMTVSGFMANHQIVGATICLIDSGKIVLVKGYGFQDLENQIPATEYTMYRTGSIAKSFTAAVALQLWEENQLNILADVRDYVPEWPVKPQGTITPYRLLAHRSGINHYQNFDTALMINYEPTHLDFDAIAALDIFKEAALLFPPGTQFGYSTFGYNLLGAVVERAANIPFEVQVRNRMNHAYHLPYLQPEYAWKRPYPQETKGYHFAGGNLVETGDDIGILYKVPGGGFICTAIDLALFSIAMMENRLYQDNTLFNWASDPSHSGSNFGLGIMNGFTWKPYLYHGGGQQRTHSIFMYYPDTHDGVVICSNTFINGFPIQMLGEDLLDILPLLVVEGEDWTPIPDTMAAPIIIQPALFDTIAPTGDSLVWMPVEHAFTYVVEQSTDASFGTSIIDTTHNNFLLLNNLLPSETYYWRVRGLNTFLYDTVVGNWSNTGAFHVLPFIGIPAMDEPNIRLFPHPTTGIVNIKGLESHHHLEVYNVHGQLVNVPFHDQMLNLSGQAKGLYFLKIQFSDEKFKVLKILLY